MSNKLLKGAVVIWTVILLLVSMTYLVNNASVESKESTTTKETTKPVVTASPTPTDTPKPSIDNYDYVVRVVMQESGNQSLEGQMAVAQCIATTAEIEGKSLYEVVTTPGQYAPPYPGQPNASVTEACERVFINGERVVDADIRWFYNPAYCTSKWHESKTYVITIGDHRFFA